MLRRVGSGMIAAEAVLNDDGRVDVPLLEGEEMEEGSWELDFHVGDYFSSRGIESPFLGVVPVRFLISAGQSYHVPLVFSPWAYQTYRGS